MQLSGIELSAIDRPEYPPRFVHCRSLARCTLVKRTTACAGRRDFDLPFSAIKSVDIERIRARCEHDSSVFGGRKLRHRGPGSCATTPHRHPHLGKRLRLLAISPRTLKRRLAEQGTTYQR